jgi:hypothetical protein
MRKVLGTVRNRIEKGKKFGTSRVWTLVISERLHNLIKNILGHGRG